MIKNLTLSLSALFCLIYNSGRTQDIHFTLYDMMPLVFNPAESGAFSGTYRLAGIYRDQWLSVTGVGNEYKTPSFSVDIPVIKGFRDQDWVGVGLMMYSDNSGSLNFKQNAFKLSAAYHLGLDKKGKSILSFGYQTGSVQFKIDPSGWMDATQDPENKYPDLLEPSNPDLGVDLKDDYVDHVGGLHFKTQTSTDGVLQLGISVGHLGRTRIKLVQGGTGDYTVQKRILAHGSYRTMFNPRLAIIPSAMVQVQGKDNEIQAQIVGEYLFNAEKQVVLKAGLGYRVGDATQVILGTDIRDLKITFGYDLNVSPLTPASNTFGAFEISAMIIGIIYKKPDPDPVLFCPRF